MEHPAPSVANIRPLALARRALAVHAAASQRLAALLEIRRHGPDGREFGPHDYVFGNEIGERVGSVKTAWRATCRRAGIDDLNFHDLRREARSRLLEGGMPEHYVQRFLDHANLSTTSRYLATTRRGMHQVFRQYEQRQAEKTGKVCKFVASWDEAPSSKTATPQVSGSEKPFPDKHLQ